jgi:hypothetical protein
MPFLLVFSYYIIRRSRLFSFWFFRLFTKKYPSTDFVDGLKEKTRAVFSFLVVVQRNLKPREKTPLCRRFSRQRSAVARLHSVERKQAIA